MTSNLVRDLDAEYGEDKGVSTLWTRPDYPRDGKPYTEVSRVFHPLQWGLGITVERHVAGYSEPHRLFVYATCGPWSWTWHREWPGDRDEFLAWQKRYDELLENR